MGNPETDIDAERAKRNPHKLALLGGVIWAKRDHRRIEEVSNGIMKCLLPSNKAAKGLIDSERLELRFRFSVFSAVVNFGRPNFTNKIAASKTKLLVTVFSCHSTLASK